MERSLSVKTNEDFEIAVRWCDQNLVPYSLSSGEMHVRASAEAANPPLLTATVTISVDNWATAVITSSALTTLVDPPDVLVYDFVATRTDGRKKVLLEGNFMIIPGVTHV